MVCCSTASFRTEADHFYFVLLLLNLNMFYLQKNESFASKEKGISNIHKIPKCTIFFKWTQIMQSSLGYIYDFHKELDASTSTLEFLYQKIHLCGNKQTFIWEIYSPLPDCPFTVYRNCQQNQVTNHCFESSHLYLSAPSTTEGEPLDQWC